MPTSDGLEQPCPMEASLGQGGRDDALLPDGNHNDLSDLRCLPEVLTVNHAGHIAGRLTPSKTKEPESTGVLAVFLMLVGSRRGTGNDAPPRR